MGVAQETEKQLENVRSEQKEFWNLVKVYDPEYKKHEKWLKENSFSNPILKWETKAWGEIPADFGRK